MTADELRRANVRQRLAQRHAHTADAERAEMEALLHTQQAATAQASARAARAFAEVVTAQAAVAEVRRLCDVTIESSVRVHAVHQARDTLAVIDSITEGHPLPGAAVEASTGLSRAPVLTSPAQGTLLEQVQGAVEASGLKRKWIAEQLHTGEKHLSHLLNGRASLTLVWAERILGVCGLELVVTVRPRSGGGR